MLQRDAPRTHARPGEGCTYARSHPRARSCEELCKPLPRATPWQMGWMPSRVLRHTRARPGPLLDAHVHGGGSAVVRRHRCPWHAATLTLLLCFALLPLPGGRGRMSKKTKRQNEPKLSNFLASRYGAEGSRMARAAAERATVGAEIGTTTGTASPSMKGKLRPE